MNSSLKKFNIDSKNIVCDLNHRKTINFNISKYYQSVEKGKLQFLKLEEARKRASEIKHHTILNLKKYLLEFEKNFTNNGGIIHWAKDSDEANKIVIDILNNEKIDLVVKSKSMITEEIELNKNLEKNKIEVVETDLGEFIVQMIGEKPYHIVTPVMHKTKEDIYKIFSEKYNCKFNSASDVTLYVRNLLREKFSKAGAGISGANFLVADIGGIAITENEGNAFITTSLPKIHIAISGIEKIIPSYKHLQLFWPLLSTYGTGQKITTYKNLITSVKKENDIDGPNQLHLILLDNGRTNLLKEKNHYIALTCIKCGSCLNNCPVYKNIGGYTYDTVYQGPIGKLINPYLKNFNKYNHLAFASTLCGKCYSECPVKLNIPELLLLTRKKAIEKKLSKRINNISIKIFSLTVKNKNLYRTIGSRTKNFIVPKLLKKSWGKKRIFPKFSSKTFTQEFNYVKKLK